MVRPLRKDIELLARQAGEILRLGYRRRPGYGEAPEIRYKGVIDLVTEFDNRSEEFLLGEIRRRFPDHRIIGEESGDHGGEEDCVWLVDPLDGTVNFAHGIPIFSVSLAYVEKGAIELGVVYDPMRDECFSAERGRGAWLNDDPIRVSSTEDLGHALLVTGFPYDIRTNPRNNLDNYARLSLLSQGVRRLGSAALDLAYVACGRFDGFWELSLNAWDLAAGGLIALEAGARVTNMQGDENFLTPPPSIVAANPALHSSLLEALQ